MNQAGIATQYLLLGILLLLFLVGGSYYLKQSSFSKPPVVSSSIYPTNQPISSPKQSDSPSIQPSNGDYYSCLGDTDCISVKADVCGCSGGVKATAINKNYSQKWNSHFPPGIACISIISDDWTCTSSEPKCISNRCELVKKST